MLPNGFAQPSPHVATPNDSCMSASLLRSGPFLYRQGDSAWMPNYAARALLAAAQVEDASVYPLLSQQCVKRVSVFLRVKGTNRNTNELCS